MRDNNSIMLNKNLNPNTITGRINLKALEILGQNPGGVRWAELNRQVQAAYPDFHPKTINGCVWKLTEHFPEKVEKPDKGLFRLKKS